LGYTFKESAMDKADIREIVKKANKVVGCVWGMGERKWGGDFRRRLMMFESMMRIRGRDLGMDIELSERDKDTDKQERGERIKDTGKSGVPEESEWKRNKNDDKIQMWE
jgi:hypothetical protein